MQGQQAARSCKTQVGSEILETVMIVAMVAGLAAGYPGWVLSKQAFYTSRKWGRLWSILASALLPLVFAAVLFYIPFLVNRGGQVDALAMFTDFVMYAICPAAVMGLIGYVWDFVSHRDQIKVLVVAGAACFSIVLLPPMYYFYGGNVMERYGIVLEDDSQGEGADLQDGTSTDAQNNADDTHGHADDHAADAHDDTSESTVDDSSTGVTAAQEND